MPRLTVWASRLLEKSPWIPVPNDKETGFTLVHHDDLVPVLASVLETSAYAPASWVDPRRPGLSREYRAFAERVANYEDNPAWTTAILKSWISAGSSMGAVLALQAKTHKAPGHVTFRNLHAAPRHCAECLSQWLDRRLSAELAKFCLLKAVGKLGGR